MRSLVHAINQFGFDLCVQILREKVEENVFFCPFTLAVSLSMVDLGARGNTAKQMEQVLHYNEMEEAGGSNRHVTAAQCDKPGGPHNQFKALLSAINQKNQKYDLSTANRLYGDIRYEFLKKYLTCTQELYHAGLQMVDFEKATEEVRTEINAWVESQTNGKITDLLPSDSIDKDTALIIVNAIYFKGKWNAKFDKEKTTEKPFWTDKNQSKNVPMMVQRGKFNLASISNPPMQVLELPYDGDDLSMYIFLPNRRGGIEEIVKEMSYEKFQEWTSEANMRNISVDISIPKFKLEEEYEPKENLMSLGMTDVFNQSKADLSGMSEKHGLYVSKVFHKAFLEVNEEGTEAAGSTGVVVVPLSSRPGFQADHPFFFTIRHKRSSTVLFIGKVSSPPATSN